MKTKYFSWLDRDFIEISAEGRAGVPADLATAELFEKFETELKASGLSLDNTARIRVWGRDKDARSGNSGAIEDSQRKPKGGKLKLYFIRMVRFGRHGRFGLVGHATGHSRRAASAGRLRTCTKLSLLS